MSSNLPTIKGITGKMNLVDSYQNVFCCARTVPIALESQVKEELTRLEIMGVITPINRGVENASPVVWIKNPTGSCACVLTLKRI